MAAVAGDVPGKYDCVIDGQGYVFLDSVEPSLPFRTHRATYSTSPTFLDRQNVSGNYGDDHQAFWLIASQNDWSLGEQQHFFRSTNDDSRRKYWAAQNIEISYPGRVTLRNGVSTSSAKVLTAQVAAGNTIYSVTATNLWSLDAAGTWTDLGAHGAGAAPTCMCYDGNNIYMSSTAGGSVGIRRYNIGTPGYSTFSATKADSVAYLNNTLFSMSNSTAILSKYDTAGTATTLYTWKGANGTALTGLVGTLRAFGANLVAMIATVTRGTELWQYDGNGTKMISQFPPDFYGADIDIAYGGIFIGGSFLVTVPTGAAAGAYIPAVLYYINGNYGELWRATSTPTAVAGTAVSALGHAYVGYFGKGIGIVDTTTLQLLSYDVSTGAISSIADLTGYTTNLFVDGAQAFIAVNNRSTIRVFPSTATVSSGYLTTSLFDLESSLNKSFRGVKIDADIPSGATIDIAYQLNSVTGAWTSLATGLTAGGTETSIEQDGRCIAFKITLNKGSSSAGPTLRRVYLRAAPKLHTYRHREFILDLTNVPGVSERQLRDGTYHPKSGRQQANDLITSSQATSAISVTDRFSTFKAFIDTDAQTGFELYEVHPSIDDPANSGGFVARVVVREV